MPGMPLWQFATTQIPSTEVSNAKAAQDTPGIFSVNHFVKLINRDAQYVLH